MTSALFSACQFREQCHSWQEAVTLACQPLEELGAAYVRLRSGNHP